jgi:thiamine kinase-like enzyme
MVDPFDDDDLQRCMDQIRWLHEKRLNVGYSFDIEDRIMHYLGLAEAIDAVRFTDIQETKQKLQTLLGLRKELNAGEVLCHGDFAHTNVLRLSGGHQQLHTNMSGDRHDAGAGDISSPLLLVDWEHSGMADPIMDVAMFAISALFDRERTELCLRMYKGSEPAKDEWARLYLYVALGGFLWSMWSEYKQKLGGEEFGEYPLKMYRYMKDYCHLATRILEQ